MGPVTGTILYIIIWWVLIFTILPWGSNAPKKVGIGHSQGAPEKPRLWMKFTINSVLSAIIWYGIYIIVTQGLVDLNAISLIEIKHVH